MSKHSGFLHSWKRGSMNFFNFFDSFIIRFLWKSFFHIVLDYHFMKTACLGKFLFLSYEPKRPQPIKSLDFSNLIS